MTEFAIQVENLSKRYRIGLKEEMHDTLFGAMTAWLKSPVANFRQLRRLSHFSDDGRDPDDVIWALKDISFQVAQGEVVGIIGRNGAGKTTLLKILSRITEPTSGRAVITGRVSSLLEVGTGFHSELTGRENVYLNGTILGMTKQEVDRKFDEIVDFSGVEKFIDTPVKRYSSGMKVRLGFSVAAHLEPEILLVDEVLAVGDVAFQKKCLGKMGDVSRLGRTILFVSHNMEAILDLCPTTFVLEDGRIAYHGGSEEAAHFYLRSLSNREFSSDPHVLYNSHLGLASSNVAEIFLVEVLDNSNKPKPFTYTWDDLVIRIHYASREDIPNGNFVLDLSDHKRQRLIVLDSGTQIPIESGRHYVDCYIPRMPLAAGEYDIGAGLSIWRDRWLWRETRLGTIRVHGKDVFGLERAPQWRRMYFAVEHEWRT